MRKIPTLYVRDENDRRHVTRAITNGCEWVIAGEGVGTRKFDGTCVFLDAEGAWWARREVKPGKNAPANFVPIETDPETLKVVGWEPVEQSPFAKFHAEALLASDAKPGTYELCGPKINGNPERFDAHRLIRHGEFLVAAPREFGALRDWLLAHHWEGVVWWRENGDKCKIKRKDFA
jgi:hypothetical protein